MNDCKQNGVTYSNLFAIDRSMNIKKSYKKSIKDLAVKFKEYDFKSNAAKSTEELNKYVKDKTNGKIEKMFEGVLNPNTKFTLINTLHFKANWVRSFEMDKKPSVFTLANGTTKNILFMEIEWRKFQRSRYIDMGTHSIVQIPFESGNLYFGILMPNSNVTDLKEFIPKMNDINKAKLRPVQLQMPSFLFHQKHDQLKQILQKMGLKDLFEYNSDLSLISSNQLNIDHVLQKAMISVNYEGVRAAAATGYGDTGAMAPQENPKDTVYLNVNRPFIYTITDRNTNINLFTGIVYDPLQK